MTYSQIGLAMNAKADMGEGSQETFEVECEADMVATWLSMRGHCANRNGLTVTATPNPRLYPPRPPEGR